MCLYDPGTCHRAGPQWMLSELTDRERERGGLSFRGGIKLTLASSHLCQMGRDSGPVLLSVAVCLLLGQRWMTHGTRSATWPPARPASPAGQLCTLPPSVSQCVLQAPMPRGPEPVGEARLFAFLPSVCPLLASFCLQSSHPLRGCNLLHHVCYSGNTVP